MVIGFQGIEDEVISREREWGADVVTELKESAEPLEEHTDEGKQ